MRQVIVKKNERLSRVMLIAERIVVKGAVHGTIFADEVDLAASAQVNGSIVYGTLRIARGARIDATLERKV